MRILWLAQSAQPLATSHSPESGYFIILLISALLAIGLLVLIGLIVAWRNNIQRQREIEADHDERMSNLPHADAWSTAAQRMDPPESEPDEAHIAPDPYGQEENFDPQNEDDEDDDFPFDTNDDDDDDDDNPRGQA